MAQDTITSEISTGRGTDVPPVIQSRASMRDRRRYPRFLYTSEASIEIKKTFKNQRLSGQIRDISPNGICFELGKDHTYQIGDTATVIWTIPKELGFTENTKTYKLTGSVVRAVNGASVNTYGIQFSRLISEQIVRLETYPQRDSAIGMALLVTAAICVLKAHNVISYWWAPIANTYSLLVCSYVFLRVGVSMFYKEPRDVGYTPSVSIIIPAKDEESHIRESILHAFGSRYPTYLFEVLIIDDGSTDHTWQILEQMAINNPRLRVFRHEKNLGKRHAMALGAREAKNDILVYVDSDSLLDPEALYRIVQPFHDPSIGAVGGQISVVTEPDNFISKMEVVRYQISQRVIKASESLFKAVTCCSGPLAAYRRTAVTRILHNWLNQTFAGERTTFGDDRSLTNFILRTHRVVYHHGAISRTYVPRTWKIFFRQQLRWKKSWSREAIIASKFMWHKHPMAAVPFYLGIFITLFSPMIALRALVYLPLVMGVSPLPYITGLILTNVFLACVFFYYTRSRYWPYTLAFSAVYIGALCWQTYYAIVTIPKNHWGTR